jgi:hypothetical protein
VQEESVSCNCEEQLDKYTTCGQLFAEALCSSLQQNLQQTTAPISGQSVLDKNVNDKAVSEMFVAVSMVLQIIAGLKYAVTRQHSCCCN